MYEMNRTGNSVKSKNSCLTLRGGGEKNGETANGYEVSLGVMKRGSNIRLWRCLHNSINTLKTTELYTLDVGEFRLHNFYLSRAIKKESFRVYINLRKSRFQSKEYYQIFFKSYFTMKKEAIHQEDITILNVYIPNNRASKT